MKNIFYLEDETFMSNETANIQKLGWSNYTMKIISCKCSQLSP